MGRYSSLWNFLSHINPITPGVLNHRFPLGGGALCARRSSRPPRLKIFGTFFWLLENVAKNNPVEMWSAFKKLCNPPNMKTALEIVKDDDSISRDIKEVLNRWMKDISGLYSGLQEDAEMVFNQSYYDEILRKKSEFESLASASNIQCTQIDPDSLELNHEISYDEVSAAIDNSKCRKAYLEIPNEALKNENAKMLLQKFFNACFVSGYNPSDWDFSDIVPIP